MSDTEIKTALECAEKATPGDWRVSSPETIARSGGGLLVSVRLDPYNPRRTSNTLAFIASARADVPALARDLLAARAALRRIYEIVRHPHPDGSTFGVVYRDVRKAALAALGEPEGTWDT